MKGSREVKTRRRDEKLDRRSRKTRRWEKWSVIPLWSSSTPIALISLIVTKNYTKAKHKHRSLLGHTSTDFEISITRKSDKNFDKAHCKPCTLKYLYDNLGQSSDRICEKLFHQDYSQKCGRSVRWSFSDDKYIGVVSGTAWSEKKLSRSKIQFRWIYIVLPLPRPVLNLVCCRESLTIFPRTT